MPPVSVADVFTACRRSNPIAIQPSTYIEIEKLFAPDHAGHRLTKNQGVFMVGTGYQAIIKIIGLLIRRAKTAANPAKGSRSA